MQIKQCEGWEAPSLFNWAIWAPACFEQKNSNCTNPGIANGTFSNCALKCVAAQGALTSVQNVNKRSNYLYCACFAFCGGHFEFLKRARSATARSGTEMETTRSLLGARHFIIIFGERPDPPRICKSQTSKTSVPDLALADRARVLKTQNGRHKTHAIKVV